MRSVLLLLGLSLVCLSHEANSEGGIVSKLFKSAADDDDNFDTWHDFKGLNKWLKAGLPGDDDPARNLEYVKSNYAGIRTIKMKAAANKFIMFLDKKQCNKDLLSSFRGLQFDDTYSSLSGRQRVKKLMNARLDELNKMCLELICDNLDKAIANNQFPYQNKVKDFMDVIILRPNQWQPPVGTPISSMPDEKFFKYISYEKEKSLDPKREWWAEKIAELTRDDTMVKYVRGEEAEHGYSKYHRESAAEHLITEYMMKPCGEIEVSIADNVYSLYALSDHQKDQGQQLSAIVGNRSSVVQLLYAFKICEALLGKNNYEKAKLVDMALDLKV